jgi:RNA polymerase sigma-70 factor, ECF subfamily
MPTIFSFPRHFPEPLRQEFLNLSAAFCRLLRLFIGRGEEEAGGLDSDQQLVRRVLSGDRQAFATLVERYQNAVFAVAMKVLQDHDAGSDAAQNAFVAAYQQLPRLRDGNAFGAWLLTIARREALAIARSRPRVLSLQREHDKTYESASETPMEETLRALMDAVGDLPDHEQRVVMLRYFNEHPVAEIAKITGRSVGTVTKQISRALLRLRNRLKDRNP